MTITIVLWMLSGLLIPSEGVQPTVETKEKTALMLVQTKLQKAQSVQLSLTVQGQVEPNRIVLIRSDIEGRIDALYVAEGDWVEQGTTLARIAIEDRKIKLTKEKAQLTSRQQSLTRIKALSKENFQSKSALEDAFAALKSAEANVAQIEFEIKKLDIKAPFSGILDERMIEEGGYIAKNGEIGRFVENNPLIVSVQVAQQNIQKVRLGALAQVSLATGDKREGKIHYISPLAQESTRTFKVEILIENEDRSIPAGISAEIELPTEKVTGHFVSPAILSLDASGQIGVKVVDEQHIVKFYPVDIIQANTQGVWISGLPDVSEIITIGQGFVDAGTTVEVKRVSRQSDVQTQSQDQDQSTMPAKSTDKKAV